jgi:hypothetical protein
VPLLSFVDDTPLFLCSTMLRCMLLKTPVAVFCDSADCLPLKDLVETCLSKYVSWTDRFLFDV